jgi:hypothetical protein
MSSVTVAKKQQQINPFGELERRSDVVGVVIVGIVGGVVENVVLVRVVNVIVVLSLLSMFHRCCLLLFVVANVVGASGGNLILPRIYSSADPFPNDVQHITHYSA